MTDREALGLIGEGRPSEVDPELLGDLMLRGLVESDDGLWLSDAGWAVLDAGDVP